jgi:hypothetical protein
VKKIYMKKLFNYACVLVCLVLSGCFASTSVTVTTTPQSDLASTKQPMTPSRNGASNYKVAVTKPPVCNDFPVSFRVLLTDNEARVRPVQKTTLGAFSEDTFTYAPNN